MILVSTIPESKGNGKLFANFGYQAILVTPPN